MSPTDGDTIVARATARGIAAIAMIRFSGPEAFDIAQRCLNSSKIGAQPTHTAQVCMFKAVNGDEIDQVVATTFHAPGTVTGEHVVEITCHGGDYVSQRVLRALVEAGARPAEPGEFTKRAFLNGKMDLAQAEAVGEMIHAGSRRAQSASLSHLKGSYSALLTQLREEMLDLCSLIELELDFTEEDVALADQIRLDQLLKNGDRLLGKLVQSYRYGAMIRDGIAVVLGGRPNAGKSTLLNALVGYDRAIVSAIPGTTRDEIREETEYDGIRIHFLDTAGLRETKDEIEAEGVRRAEASIRRADVLIYVYDVLVGLDDEEKRFLDVLTSSDQDIAVLVVANKSDLLGSAPPPADHIALSAKAAMHDEDLVRPLLEAVVQRARSNESIVEGSDVVTNERHHAHLVRAHEAVRDAAEAVQRQATNEVVAIDLRIAMQEIGAITGATATEDILGHIFSKFCIGK